MITLLHTEIDVVPGRRPQRQALPEGFVGMGTAVLRITNTSGRENAYTIRVQCDEPYWQDSWYKLSAMPPAPGQTSPPASKPDQFGPKEQWIKVFVSHTGTRDVLLSFFVPDKPESRSGVYPIKVIVETQVTTEDAGARAKERFTEINGTVIVRPFYKWQVEFQPPERRVGFLRRKASYEMVLHNQGNDWLYCDIKLGKAQHLLVDVDSYRLAVPPPEPGKDSFRSLPVRVRTKRRMFRGAVQPDELPFTFQRLDAPTVPPLPEEAASSVCGAGLGAPVLHSETNELIAPETPAKAVYCPPIPATLTEFVQSIARNAMAISLLFIGLVMMAHMAAFMWDSLARRMDDFEPLTMSVAVGQPIRVKGSYIVGQKVFFEKVVDGDTVEEKPVAEKVVGPDARSGSNILNRGNVPTDDIPEGVYRLRAQRSSFFSYLNPLLPSYYKRERRFFVTIGNPPKSKPPVGEIILPDSVKPGDRFEISGPDFATDVKVYFGNVAAKTTPKGKDTIVVYAPADFESDRVTIRVMREGESQPLAKHEVAVVWPMDTGDLPPDQPPGGGAAPGGGATSSGRPGGTSAGGAGSGGTTPPPARPRIPGYNELVAALSSEDYGTAASALDARADLQNPASFAVNAFALAAQGNRDEARRMIGQARTVMNATRDQKLRNDAQAILLAAEARLLDTPRAEPRDVARKYGDALNFALANNTVAFPGLVLVEYLIRVDQPQAALQILERVRQSLTLTDAEKAVARRLENAARS